MKTLGLIVKEKRNKREMTLRRFCEKANLDPSNWSKIERGLIEAPKSRKALDEIADILDMNSEERQEILDLAIIESIPKDIKPNQRVLDALPVFFRTARELKPSEEEIRNLIELLKHN